MDILETQQRITDLSAQADFLAKSGAPIEEVEAVNFEIQELDFQIFEATGQLQEMFVYNNALLDAELAA